MNIALYILISYLLGVSLYTIIVRNNATNKHVPHINVWEIVKQGLRGIGIGFIIVGAIIGLLYLFMFLTH